MRIVAICLDYGLDRRFAFEVDADRVRLAHAGPAADPRLRESLRTALNQPLEFPPLREAIVPGDRIVMALDRETPSAAVVLAELWSVFEQREIDPENVLVLQPASLTPHAQIDPRSALPADVRERVGWRTHDPTRPDACAYLASSVSGERVYLARDVVDADFVLPIGAVGYDSVLGYRGTGSVLYPGLSNTEAIARSRGQGHTELGPDDERPLRQLIDEITWLLGVQFAVQVIPSSGSGAAHVLAGSTEAVLRRGKELLSENWRVTLDQRADVVVAAIGGKGEQNWEQIGAALEAARQLVTRGGKIVLLTDLAAELEKGMESVRDSQSPREALKPLRQQSPPDLVAATQLAQAADWAQVYLLSRLDSDLVEDLFMIPLANEREVQRLLGGHEDCVFLGGAQHTYGEVVED